MTEPADEIKNELKALRNEIGRIGRIVDQHEFDKKVNEAIKRNGDSTAIHDQTNKGLIKYLLETIKILVVSLAILLGTKLDKALDQIKSWFN